MGKRKVRICEYCKQEIENNQPSQPSGKKIFHASCYRKYETEKYEKDKTETERLKEIEDEVNDIFGLEDITPMLRRQIQKIFEENPKFTYNGVLHSIKYYYQVMGNEPDTKYGLGFIPFIYKEAKEFYIMKNKVIDKLQKDGKFEQEIETYVYKPPKSNKNKHIINMEKL